MFWTSVSHGSRISPQLWFVAKVSQILILMVGIVAGWGGSAEARTSKCVQLERQLASVSSAGSGASNYRSAIRKQERQLSTVKRRMRSSRCSGGASSSTPACRKLKSLYSKMNRNLRALKARERKLSGRGGNSASKRNRILKSMRRNKCSDGSQRVAKRGNSGILQQLFGSPNAAAPARKSRRAAYDNNGRRNNFNLLQHIFGTSRRGHTNLDDPSYSRNGRLDRQFWSTSRRYGNYNSVRTLCVRKCDGYYFPVSFSTDVSGIDDDAIACANLCPGRAMELYSHDTNNETPDQMRSTIDGTPYVDLDIAYAYREAYKPECACNHKLLDRRNDIDVPNSGLKAEYIRSVVPPSNSTLPKARPSQSTADSTIAQRRLSKSSGFGSLREKRQVRVVGDEFFPTQ